MLRLVSIKEIYSIILQQMCGQLSKLIVISLHRLINVVNTVLAQRHQNNSFVEGCGMGYHVRKCVI